MQPELDSETLKLADVVATAPQMSAVVAEAQVSVALDGNFAERDPVLPQNDAAADNTLNIQPPSLA